MFARVSTYRAGDAEKLLAGFDNAIDPLEQIDGFSHAYFLIDRESGRAMSITVWKTEEALNASVAKADELRSKAAGEGGGSIQSVDHYEIALTAGEVPAGVAR